MTDDATPNDTPADDAGIAPRPRPGFKSRRVVEESTVDKPALFAGILRATLGAVGVFASLLYLPIQTATPILAGVSILMMVTGTTSTWRATRETPSPMKRAPLVLAGLCAVVTLASVVLTLVLGAGSLGPVAEARRQAAEAARRDAPPTVHFEAP
jgi:hypothetical protein